MTKWWNGKPKRKRPSDRGEIQARIDEAKKKPSKEIDFDWDETTDVIDLTLEELRRTSQASLEEIEKTTKDLRKIGSVRPPPPAPLEKAKTG